MTVFLSPLAGVGSQFFDNSGNVLSGGLLYTYAAGSTTPQTTYTDINGGTANANPIVLDAAGRLESEVWLTGGVAYKFILQTSTGSLLGTYDDIYGINDLSAVGVQWADVLNTPTTLAGYGITDALTDAEIAALYAPLASPALTGDPTAEDAAAGSAYTLGYRDVPQNLKTANYQLLLSDRGKSVVMNGTSLTLTIPANASVAFPLGTAIAIINSNSTALSIAITTDTLTLANSTTTGTRTLAQNGIATIVKTSATAWLISGTGIS